VRTKDEDIQGARFKIAILETNLDQLSSSRHDLTASSSAPSKGNLFKQKSYWVTCDLEKKPNKIKGKKLQRLVWDSGNDIGHRM